MRVFVRPYPTLFSGRRRFEIVEFDQADPDFENILKADFDTREEAEKFAESQDWKVCS